MPRARRRRARSVARRSWGRTLVLALAAAVTLVLVVGSIAEIHAQSGGYRSSIDAGYGALAVRVVEASNQTGTELAALMDTAPSLTNQALPRTARAVLEQGLDAAVAASAQESDQAAHLVPPDPTGQVSDQFTAVMAARAAGTADLRSTVDQLLGMTPLPIAGAPATSIPPAPAVLISIGQASTAMGNAGLIFQRSDVDFANLTAQTRKTGLPIHLPRSVWVPVPVASAPLGSPQLAATAAVLGNSAALAPNHRLALTAVGLSPPAVSAGGPGLLGGDCANVGSNGPGPAPTVLPPTSTVTAEATVTNCGTVPETGVVVTQTLALADPAGTAPPRPSARGSASRVRVALRSGSSMALRLPSLSVATGHLYTLTVQVAVPASQQDTAGSTQQFLLQISG
ncbi:MAG TPA: hypothetical protein VII46_06695 [Acidimicrobiales bacterium]